MAMIRPSSDLRNHYNEISEFCHKTNQPVYITKNGAGDLVVLSNEDYERLIGPKAELYRKIEEGLEDECLGKVFPAKNAIEQLSKELGIE
ncbi:type II toxin-antitoxin system Phd/YefM family antitoxin [Ruminococcus sp.]|uniref:type II toxin-antitoxin system Phd/YefM family antitoxin n=1 Tax=Ruminococcus sp. TaxID=41978 RepID=UPI002E7FCB95|nr:type II toxin-antitoxin system Phd/YefM family antitoxin [Ruminococcus sp.]MEE3491379.1 type II toxin-antitoxin system Phd/YefM family antitoxin [Ruminococcus sp.]